MPTPSAAESITVASNAGIYSSKGPLLMTGIVATKAPSLLAGLVLALILASEIEPRKVNTPLIRLTKTPQVENRPPETKQAAVSIARLQLPPPPHAAKGVMRRTAAKSTTRHATSKPFIRTGEPLRAATPPSVPSSKVVDQEPFVITPMAPPERQPKPLKRQRTRAPQKAKPVQATNTEVAALAPRDPGQRDAQQAVDGRENRSTGRALLRLLEHGKGPTIEIAWPKAPAEREQLYLRFTQCYGVRAAILDSTDRLFDRKSNAGISWNIERDRFSGFLRSPAGEPIRQESRQFAQIADHHDLVSWRPVRVFPRNVDAILLGGLEAIIGKRYQSSSKIRGAYEMVGAKVILTSITVDGRALAGSVDLSGAAARACRVAAGR